MPIFDGKTGSNYVYELGTGKEKPDPNPTKKKRKPPQRAMQLRDGLLGPELWPKRKARKYGEVKEPNWEKYTDALAARQLLMKIIQLTKSDAERKQASAELVIAERKIVAFEQHSAATPVDNPQMIRSLTWDGEKKKLPRQGDRPQTTTTKSWDENKSFMTTAAAEVGAVNHKNIQLPFKLRSKQGLPVAQAQIKKGKSRKPSTRMTVYERPGPGTITTQAYRDLTIKYWTKERKRQADKKASIRAMKRR